MMSIIDIIVSVIGVVATVIRLIYDIIKDNHKESNPPDQE